MAINSRLLDMQGTKGLTGIRTRRLAIESLAFIILAILNFLSMYYVCTYKLEQA
jgi:hypothetical protein